MQHLRYKSGFTLLEVLIALVILSVAFSAVYLSLSASAYHLVFLKDKTAADWVGLNAIAKANVKLVGANANGTEKMFQTNWHWELSSSPSADPYVLKAIVKVNKEGQTKNIIQLEGYLPGRQ